MDGIDDPGSTEPISVSTIASLGPIVAGMADELAEIMALLKQDQLDEVNLVLTRVLWDVWEAGVRRGAAEIVAQVQERHGLVLSLEFRFLEEEPPPT